MIDPEFCQMMARYNLWQNQSLYREAGRLSDDDRRADRGAFFGSIHATLGHILWGDRIWMSRLDGWKRPTGRMADSMGIGWRDLSARRKSADQEIQLWAKQMKPFDLDGDLVWYSGVLNAEVQKPKWMLIQHFFNHQTHHRGQVHAMITAAGGTPDPTDLPFMPTTI